MDSTIRYPFVIFLWLKIENTNQVTTIGDVDYGWKNFLTTRNNASNNDIRVGAFFTKKNTHTLGGAYDNPVANFDVAGGSHITLCLFQQGDIIRNSKNTRC